MKAPTLGLTYGVDRKRNETVELLRLFATAIEIGMEDYFYMERLCERLNDNLQRLGYTMSPCVQQGEDA